LLKPWNAPAVQFVHRSVYDFLREWANVSDVLPRIEQGVEEYPRLIFGMVVMLAHAVLQNNGAVLRGSERFPEADARDSHLGLREVWLRREVVDIIFHWSRKMELQTDERDVDLLDGVDRTLTWVYEQYRPCACNRPHWTHVTIRPCSGFIQDASRLLHYQDTMKYAFQCERRETMILAAMRAGLSRYFKAKLDTDGPKLGSPHWSMPPLAFAVSNWVKSWDKWTIKYRSEFAIQLLERGADPREVFTTSVFDLGTRPFYNDITELTCSIWEYFWLSVASREGTRTNVDDSMLCFKLVQHGADAKLKMMWPPTQLQAQQIAVSVTTLAKYYLDANEVLLSFLEAEGADGADPQAIREFEDMLMASTQANGSESPSSPRVSISNEG
jgi:hypothetical protein